ncbi:MAG: translocation/assembly module TamB domain-containing protein [bacterium]
MKWLRLLVVFVVVTAVVAVVVLRHRLLDEAAQALRVVAEREASLALNASLVIGELHLSLTPPGIEASAVTLGADGAIGRVGHLSARLLLRTSLRQRRPVLDVDADDVSLDLPALLTALPPTTPEPVILPAFRFRRVRVHGAALQITDEPDALHGVAPQLTGTLSADGPLGRLRFYALAAPLELQQGERRLVFERAAARGGETADGWRLQALELHGDGIALSGAPRQQVLALNGQVDLIRLRFFADELATLEGTATIDGTLDGPLDEPLLHGTARVPALQYDGRPLGDVEATAQLALTALTVESARLRGLDGEVAANGTLTFDAALPFHGRVSWSQLDTRQAAALVPADAPALAANGNVDVSGTFSPLHIEASGDGRFLVATAGATPIVWRGGGTYAAPGGRVTLEVTQGNGNRADLDATIGGRGELAGALRAQVADPDGLRGVLPVSSLPNVRGSANASAQLSGSVGDPRLQGELNARDLVVADVRIDRAAGAFAVTRHALRSDGVTLAIGGGSASLAGVLALDASTENAWTLRVKGVDGGVVAALSQELAGAPLPISGGTLTADATAQGAWQRIRVNGSAALDKFWFGREHIEHFGVTVKADGGRWTGDAQVRNRPDQRLDVRASGEIGGAIALDANGEWTLTSLQQGQQTAMGGALHVSATLRGLPAALNGTAELRTEGLVLAGRPIGAVRVTAQATRGRWVADTALLDGAFTAHLDVRPEPGMPFVLSGAWRDANLARLLSDQLEARIDSSGTLRANGRLAALAQAEAELQATQLSIVQDTKALTIESPLTITCRRGTCNLARVALRGPNSALSAVGEMSFDGRVHLVIDGAGDLALLELLGEPVESARGRYSLNATVARGAAGLSITGNLTFDNFGIDAGLPVAVTKAQGRLSLDGTTVFINELSGRIGTGTFRVTGAINLRSGPDIGWELKDVGVIPLPSLEMELSGHGTVRGAWDSPLVAGDLLVHRMLYDKDFEFTDFLPSFNRALASAPRAAGASEIRFDLHVLAPAQLFVENNVARVEGRADLRLTGTAARPILAGRVEGLDGEVRVRGRTFELQGATADFRPDLGLGAALNISAESLIDTPDATYTVGVRVTGTTQNPRVALSSDDPSLSQTDIATLIAVGKTTTQLRTGGGGGFSAYDALSFVPRQITEGVQGGAKQLLPIDRIEFESAYSRTTGSYEPQLKIGKDLTDNLSVSVGQTFGVASRTSVEADYKLGPRVSIPLLWETQTETEAGALGGGIKVRYEFWRVTPFTLLSGLR